MLSFNFVEDKRPVLYDARDDSHATNNLVHDSLHLHLHDYQLGSASDEFFPLHSYLEFDPPLSSMESQEYRTSHFEPLSSFPNAFPSFTTDPTDSVDGARSADSAYDLEDGTLCAARDYTPPPMNDDIHFLDCLRLDSDLDANYGVSPLDLQGFEGQLPGSAGSSVMTCDTASLHSSLSSSSIVKSEDNYYYYTSALHSDVHYVSDDSSTPFTSNLNSPSMRTSASFPGLIADFNMFDKTPAFDELCVAPHDLMGPLTKIEEERDSDDALSERWAFPTLQSVVRQPEEQEQHNEPQVAHQQEGTGDIVDWSGMSSGELSRIVDFAFQQVQVSLPFFAPDPNLEVDIEHGQQSCGDCHHGVIFQQDGTMSQAGPARRPLSDKTTSARNNKPYSADNVKRHIKTSDVSRFVNDGQINDVVLVNSHMSVSIADVAMKTAFFRSEHPGQNLTDEHLFNFAGRLSETGEQITGYRCYIVDCFKTTKRKDHMADHIRTHLGEKPFRCTIWYVQISLKLLRVLQCQSFQWAWIHQEQRLPKAREQPST